jgi:precorrin-6Y C5,15-methyltransferase (decarboxylating)
MENRKVVILFSGDSGFYSGCQSLYTSLQEEVNAGRLKATVRIMPGISSVAYLAASIGESYQDASIYSMHGKKLYNLARKIKTEQKIYIIMSGVKDVNQLGRVLVEADIMECVVLIGYQLSYIEQKIKRLTPEECCELKEEGLYTCFIKNPNVAHKKLTHGTSDEEFIRDKVPMTKEEVREVSICKLKLHEGGVVYDIGSGTGSIAVEIAGLSDDIQVYAIEKKKEAVSLIEKNKERFQLENITVVETKAPEGLAKLPKATHAFIGGSQGNLKEILSMLYSSNSNMRVVINAISMETICELKEVLSRYPTENEEIVQMQVSRTKKAGQYHLMQAENPVWICAFDFCKLL